MRIGKLAGILVVAMILTSLSAQIRIVECVAESSVRATGGGGGTPITDGPRVVGVSNPAGYEMSQIAAASGPANDGLGADRGNGSASSTTQVDVSIGNTVEISGTGATSADFLATADLGVGQGICRLSLSIVFVLESDQAYTFVAESSGVVGSTDSIKLKRFQPPFGPATVHLTSSIQNVNASGTLVTGTYQIEASFESGISGGYLQEGASVADAFSFALDFTDDPVVEGNVLADFAELKIQDYFFGANGESFLTFDANQGESYHVATSDDLLLPWEAVDNTGLTAGSAGRYTIALPNFTDLRRFFRVEVLSVD